MKRKTQFISGVALLAVFILFTISLTFADRQPIGPMGSQVAYAGINKAAHELFGVHMMLYYITDWAGVVAIGIAAGFGALGLVQWVKRKSIFRVDSGILLLGVFYILVFGAYAFFEYHVINYRPVLINGALESSYPSSTTVLVMCVVPTAMVQFRRLICDPGIRIAVNGLCGLFALLVVAGRLISGVHWFTDILGGLLFSGGMVLLYSAANRFLHQ